MLIDRVVINASPLIILFRGHLESLLPVLFSEICIPEAVWSEVTGGRYRDESVAAELDNLCRLGLWLSDELVDLFLEEAGEK
jgi:predicted nucleic acid-binding protein